MDRYSVISSHTVEDCKMDIKYFREYHAGFLTHFEWGCYDNDHTAYAIIEAESHVYLQSALSIYFALHKLPHYLEYTAEFYLEAVVANKK